MMNFRFTFKQRNCFFFSFLLVSLLLGGTSSCTKNKSLKIDKSETFYINLGGEPENLHPIRSTDVYSSDIQDYVLESLLQRNKDTYEWEPLLAQRWEISPDGKVFTFELHDNLKWSDGKPLTTQDIKFSFEAYQNPEYGGIRFLPYFEKMDSVEILSDKKIKFTVKEPYFGNFQVMAGMAILPEHIYKDPKTKLSKNIIGSGPYVLDQYIKGKLLTLKKNPLWEGKNHPVNKGKWRFQAIAFRFIKTDTDVLLRMEKGHLDFSGLTAEAFVEKTKQAPWGTDIRKVQYTNKQASGYGYIGFNLKKPLFQDRKVRKALAHLLNRRLINKKFYYNQRELARGPWYFWSEYADPHVKPIEFNPKKAIEILKSAGWDDKDKNGILEKVVDGTQKELAFTILFSHPDSEKYLTTYQEELKQAGIKLSLKILDWASFLRLIDDRNFDAVLLGWGKISIHFDPKSLWHSEGAKSKGSNYISYSNPEVDALIDKGRSQLNRKERIKTFQKIYKAIAEDVPYIFFFNAQKKFYGVNKRIDSPADAFNYSDSKFYWGLKSNP